MKSIRILSMVALAVTLFAAAASAHPTNRVDRREARQHSRIVDGRRGGDLTRREARGLQRGQRHVRRVERRAWADGRMNGREHARLERMQDRQSRRIHRLRHNGRSI